MIIVMVEFINVTLIKVDIQPKIRLKTTFAPLLLNFAFDLFVVKIKYMKAKNI